MSQISKRHLRRLVAEAVASCSFGNTNNTTSYTVMEDAAEINTETDAHADVPNISVNASDYNPTNITIGRLELLPITDTLPTDGDNTNQDSLDSTEINTETNAHADVPNISVNASDDNHTNITIGRPELLPITNTLSTDDDNTNQDSLDVPKQLAFWVVKHNISHLAVNNLLRILQPSINNLPKDVRSLLGTPRSGTFQYIDVPPGKYCHYGIEKGLQYIMNKYPNTVFPKYLKINLNIDGLPLSKSTSYQFWPILVSVCNVSISEPILVGLYYGKTKPNSSNELMSEFVKEMLNLQNNGMMFNGSNFKIKINAIICDAPAKSFLLCVKGHNSYFGCNKCYCEGSFVQNRMTFPELNCRLRTDDDFKNKIDEEYHNSTTILQQLDVKLVTQVPLDYMHLVCIGVVKRILKFLVHGPKNIKLPSNTLENIDVLIDSVRSLIPSEFARLPRPLSHIDYWKATELRFFILYLGPHVLKSHVPKVIMTHLMSLHTALRILVAPSMAEKYNSYAAELLLYFVKNYGKIYGMEYVNYNVHNLIHLAADVQRFGSLDKFSSFSFENYLHEIKLQMKNSSKPLEQISNRTIEKRNNFLSEKTKYPFVVQYDENNRLVINENSFYDTVRNNCCITSDDSIILIKEIITSGKNIKIAAIKYENKEICEYYPCNSNLLKIFYVDDHFLCENTTLYDFTQLKYKCFKLPLQHVNKSIVLPLLHHI